MRKSIKLITTLALTMCLSLGLSVSAFAASTTISIPINTNDNKEVQDAVKAASLAIGGTSATTVTVKTKKATKTDGSTNVTSGDLLKIEGNAIVFNTAAFKDGNSKETKKAMTAFMRSIQESGLSDDTQSEIMTQIQESDPDVAPLMIAIILDATKADMGTAYKWLYPFLVVLRVVFGVGATLLIFITIGSTIIDMAYIGLPVWREANNEKGKKHPPGVSYEALTTVMEVEKNLGEAGYKNAYMVYLKRRATAYIFLSLCILYLLAGELGGLVSALLNMFSGIV